MLLTQTELVSIWDMRKPPFLHWKRLKAIICELFLLPLLLCSQSSAIQNGHQRNFGRVFVFKIFRSVQLISPDRAHNCFVSLQFQNLPRIAQTRFDKRSSVEASVTRVTRDPLEVLYLLEVAEVENCVKIYISKISKTKQKILFGVYSKHSTDIAICSSISLSDVTDVTCKLPGCINYTEVVWDAVSN